MVLRVSTNTPVPLDPEGRPDLARGLSAVRTAAERLRDVARETPSVYSYTVSEATGRDVWLKLENLQRTGSFKVRGAINKVDTLDPATRARGLVAASAGNHAQGVALAARLAGIEATIVMPVATALIKVRRTEGYGAKIVLHGRSYDEAQVEAQRLAAEEGRTLIHPFDDFDVMAGQGTVSLELLAQVPAVDTVVVPVGGGGLISGMAFALKALRPDVRLIGVQAAGAAPMAASLSAGRRISVAEPRTIADGIRVGTAGEHTFAVVRALVDEVVTVDEAEITEAVVQLLLMSKVVAEAAGAAAVAALFAGKVAGGRTLCAVVSGGNIDLNLLGRMIESGLANQGLYHVAVVRLLDAPGELQRVVDVLRETKSNIVDIQHHRAGWKVPVGYVDVEILVETRHAGQGGEVERRLSEAGLTLLDRPGASTGG
jgi:threonine dehydratase